MRRRAFTLIEAVVALAIFTLCAGIVLETLAGTRLALFGALRDATPGADRRLIVRTILRAPDVRTLTAGGRMRSPDESSLVWRCEVAPTPVVDLHRVTVLLRRERKDGGTTEETFTLHALRPAWSDPVAREAAIARRRSEDPGPYPAD